jgi:hypothetical protein
VPEVWFGVDVINWRRRRELFHVSRLTRVGAIET